MKFIEECWDWTHEYGGIITSQIKRMGCSIDFDDEKFTMDENYEAAVRKVFCDWYHDGLIYRGKRIVNWCPDCTTAISDDRMRVGERAIDSRRGCRAPDRKSTRLNSSH